MTSVIFNPSTSSLLFPTTDGYEVAISTESEPLAKHTAGLAVVPDPLTRKSDGSRPKVSTTPCRNKTDESLLEGNASEIGASRVNSGGALVDFETAEAGDISADIDIDPSMLSESGQPYRVLLPFGKFTPNTLRPTAVEH